MSNESISKELQGYEKKADAVTIAANLFMFAAFASFLVCLVLTIINLISSNLEITIKIVMFGMFVPLFLTVMFNNIARDVRDYYDKKKDLLFKKD